MMVCVTINLSPLSAATKLNPEQHHFMDVWGSLGYSAMLHNMPETKIPSGVSPTIGVGYRYFRNNFIFQTGIEGRYVWMKSVMDEVVLQERMYDSDVNKEPFTMNVQLNNRKDIYHTASVSIPLYFGYEKNRFYFLAGVAANVGIYGKAESSSDLTTKAQYDRYIGLFEDMPNHGLSNLQVQSGKMNYGAALDLMVHAEIGARLDHFTRHKIFRLHPNRMRMYLAAFMDCGVLSINSKAAVGDQLTMDFSHGVNAIIVPLLLSNQMSNRRLNNLIVGIKYTIAFELPQRGKSYIYDYDQVENNYRIRGGNQTLK